MDWHFSDISSLRYPLYFIYLLVLERCNYFAQSSVIKYDGELLASNNPS